MLPVSDQQDGLACALTERITSAGLRARRDPAATTLGARIRRARERRIPYVIVIGDREQASGLLAVRLRDGRRLNGIGSADLIAEISAQVASRSPGLGFGAGAAPGSRPDQPDPVSSTS